MSVVAHAWTQDHCGYKGLGGVSDVKLLSLVSSVLPQRFQVGL